MKSKFLLLIVLLTATVTGNLLPKADAATPVVYGSVILNGEPLSFNAKPIIIHGNTMVPCRQIFESLGMKVDWDLRLKILQQPKPA
ncbi:stalk domain-containing protein [Paenibacillus pinistramenti]|uniref:stalk domain-containing protein n=1 Tax=Paenibacillus pinistramenti TaxID=1768003 RepID=UPI0013969DB1|nr:stalk domain-containing protein [Paenibacillus pinistramenti]